MDILDIIKSNYKVILIEENSEKNIVDILKNENIKYVEYDGAWDLISHLETYYFFAHNIDKYSKVDDLDISNIYENVYHDNTVFNELINKIKSEFDNLCTSHI